MRVVTVRLALAVVVVSSSVFVWLSVSFRTGFLLLAVSWALDQIPLGCFRCWLAGCCS